MKTQLERARERHNALVEQCNKAMDRFSDAADVLVKRRIKAQALIRAVVRSEKRMKKLREEAAKPRPKAPAPVELNDKLPKELVAKVVAKSRKRRTPDDFAAEIKDRRGQAAASETRSDPFLG
jgi:hypothetical protein